MQWEMSTNIFLFQPHHTGIIAQYVALKVSAAADNAWSSSLCYNFIVTWLLTPTLHCETGAEMGGICKIEQLLYLAVPINKYQVRSLLQIGYLCSHIYTVPICYCVEEVGILKPSHHHCWLCHDLYSSHKVSSHIAHLNDKERIHTSSVRNFTNELDIR